MVIRIIFCFALMFIASCSTAKMALDPGLEVNSDKYQITERPVAFAGGDLVFGPYKATKISRGFIKSSSLSILGFGKKKEGQDFTYQFSGKGSWNGDCKVKSGNKSIGRISGGYYAGIHCTFAPLDSAGTTFSDWKFNITGQTSGEAQGSINIRSKTFRVAAINKIEGSILPMGQHTGYYFYSGERLIAGVDTISHDGPVWLSKKLTADEKDAIGLVVVALLLNNT